ncbi:MAG: 23S rRNA (adenine(2503)-C(2))-methyltransferase RlmN [Candidatus Omnitrophica bacterium]|nr:23S rRNA (adenine(2503)-C(2))-methyltransferase RlmN [Candidatus Omnitrophota bacterium]
MPDIKNLSLKELQDILESWNKPSFHAAQIFSWIYQKGVLNFEQMSDLPADLRKELKDNFSIRSLELVESLESVDQTKKILFKLEDGNFIESVIIPSRDRVTGCVSTQVGCKYNCCFCASGLSGFKRNLSIAEIIEEILFLKDESAGYKLSHLVFMGTGEPLDNYENLLKVIRMINSKETLNIGARRITISTCGLIPGIKKLAEEGLQIELSVSLHAADDQTRSQLIPINKKYPLKDLLKACEEYIEKTDRQITFEYILIKGLNSDLKHAQRLAKILENLRLVKVNLIPANSIKELKIQPAPRAKVLAFKDYLLKHGINVTLRQVRGEDINAACGQLRLRYENK